MKKHLYSVTYIMSTLVVISSVKYAQAQVLHDPLIGGSSGTVSGGTFIADGWRVDHGLNYIYWHVSPTITHGAYEVDIRGLGPGMNTPTAQKAELTHMYDANYQNADTTYIGYRNNPYKHTIRKQRRLDGIKEEYMIEHVWKIIDNEPAEFDAGYLIPWDPNHTYTIRGEWAPDGQGNTVCKIFRNGVELHSTTIAGTWQPTIHSFKIGSTLRSVEDGAYVGSVYSNFRVWNLAIPNIDEVTPDPDTAFVGFEYIRQLVVQPPGTTANWSVLIGRPGMTVDTNGLVSGWTPTAGEIVSPLTVRIQAQNTGGTDTEQWLINVKYLGDIDEDQDVDLEDFGKLQACYSGDGILYNLLCGHSDFDKDGDVDQSDFLQFQGCIGGANLPPTCP